MLHGDISLPVARREEETRRQIKVYERGSQLEILSRVPGTYMWVSPMPKDVLERFGLTVKRCDTCLLYTSYPKEETETLEMYAARVEPVVKRYLDDTLAMLWRAFELLPIRSARGIVENIAYLGMPERQRTVLKKWSGGLLEERKPVSD